MVTLDRMLKIMKAKSVSQKELCEHIGVNKQAFTNWKNGHNASYKKYLPEIAKYLEVSVEYLIGNTDDPTQKQGETNVKFDDFSFAFYEECKDLSDEDKQRLLTFARMLKDSIAEEKKINGK